MSKSKAKKRKTSKKKLTKKNEGIPFTDVKTKQVYFLKKKDLEKELEKIYNKISSILSKFEKLGNYDLKSVDISLGVSGGVVVFTVEGGVTLHYEI